MDAVICNCALPLLPCASPPGQSSCQTCGSSIHALQEVLDAVICDPPYGVRAGGRKVAPRPEICVPEGRAHFPVTEPYLMGECLRDLLHSAARLLRLGGRLCFFIPASEDTYDVSGSRAPFWSKPLGLDATWGQSLLKQTAHLASPVCHALSNCLP